MAVVIHEYLWNNGDRGLLVFEFCPLFSLNAFPFLPSTDKLSGDFHVIR
jgi:hypothetical protein